MSLSSSSSSRSSSRSSSSSSSRRSDSKLWSYLSTNGGISNTIASTSNAQNIICLPNPGTPFYSTNSGASWTNTTLTGGTSVAYANDSGLAYVVNTPHLYKTTNYGASWSTVYSSL